MKLGHGRPTSMQHPAGYDEAPTGHIHVGCLGPDCIPEGCELVCSPAACEKVIASKAAG